MSLVDHFRCAVIEFSDKFYCMLTFKDRNKAVECSVPVGIDASVKGSDNSRSIRIIGAGYGAINDLAVIYLISVTVNGFRRIIPADQTEICSSEGAFPVF